MGRHRRSVARTRLAVAIVAVAVAVGVVMWPISARPAIAIPSDPCASPPPMVTWHGVTLQRPALLAFRAAQREAGRRIPVVWSYRSCAQQRQACTNICGNANGCPELCAPPGRSWHQLGAAIDTTAHALKDPAVKRALLDNGWCQPLPTSDPGHFSFGGCH